MATRLKLPGLMPTDPISLALSDVFGERAQEAALGAAIPAPAMETPVIPKTGGFINPTKRKPVNGIVPDVPDVEAMIGRVMHPFQDAAKAAEIEQAKNAGIKLGGDAEKRMAADRAKQAADAKAEADKATNPPTFFSKRDQQKLERKEKLQALGLSPGEIAKRLDNTIFSGATNVPGDVSKRPKDFLEQNNLTTTPPPPQGTGGRDVTGFTPKDDWDALFRPRNQPVHQAPNFNAPQRGPAVQAVAGVLGNDWHPQDGEGPDAVRARRADMIRSTVAPDAPGWHNPQSSGIDSRGTTFGVTGFGAGEIVPTVPGATAEAGMRAFTSPYGEGFSNVPRLPSAAPANDLTYPVADESKLRLRLPI